MPLPEQMEHCEDGAGSSQERQVTSFYSRRGLRGREGLWSVPALDFAVTRARGFPRSVRFRPWSRSAAPPRAGSLLMWESERQPLLSEFFLNELTQAQREVCLWAVGSEGDACALEVAKPTY